MAPNLRRVLGHDYILTPTGVAADDTAALNTLIDGIPANAKARVIIRDNGQPLRLGVVGGAATTKSITGKSIFFRGETKNAKIIWGVGAGTETQGLYTLNYGGFTSPLRITDVMPSNVTRVAMGAAGVAAGFSVVPSPNVALSRGDRVLVWADGPAIATVGPHNKGGSQRPGELHRVQWSSGTNYTLDNFVYDAMTANPMIAKVTLLEQCGFADLTFGYEGAATRTSGYNFLDVRYTLGFVMENITVDDTGVGTIFTHINDKMRLSGYDCRHMTHASDYGVVDNVNRDMLVEDWHTRFLRHLHTTGGYSDPTKQWTISSTATGGTFAISMNGGTTGALAYNASAATIQSALEALGGVGAGNVFVTAWPTGIFWTISVQGTLAPLSTNTVTINGSGLTGGTATLVGSVARYGNSRGTQLRNCKCSIGGLASNAVQYGFDTHAEGIDVTYRDCIVEIGAQDTGSVGSIGFSVRSRGQKFYDCQVLGNRVYSTVVRNVHRGWQQVGGSGTEWHRCRAEQLWQGIDFDGDFYDVMQDNFLIRDCTFERCTGNGVRSIKADGGFGVVDGIRIENSRFFNNGESVGSSTRGAAIHIIRGTNHRIKDCLIDMDVNRYSVSFEGLTSSNVQMTGNSMRGYTTFGTNKMGIRGQTGDPYGASEATAEGFQTAYGSSNYTTA